jgi:hypothetical protein
MVGRAGGFAVSAWTFWSAFAFTTEVTGVSVAPASAWFASGPIIVETATVATCINPVVAFAAAGFGLYHLVKANGDNNDKRQLERQVEWYEHSEYNQQSRRKMCQHRPMGQWLTYISISKGKSLVISAWSVASDTEMMLGWVHCTRLFDPKTCLPADEYRSDQKIIEQYEKMANAPRKRQEIFVGQYLKRQKETLASIQESLKEVPQSDNDSSSNESSD